MQGTISVIALILSATLLGCGSSQEAVEAPPTAKKKSESDSTRRGGRDACLFVVNGQVTNQFAPVVALLSDNGGLCSGTFVSSSTVITAAHCLVSEKDPGLSYQGIRPTAAFHHGIVGSNAPANGPANDLAVLVFPEGTAPDSTTLAAKAPKAGDAMTVVGFGQTDFLNNNQADGLKRVGRNVVAAVDEASSTFVYESPVSTAGLAPGEKAMSGRGDSGGPIFTETGLVAVTSSGGEEGGIIRERDVLLFSAKSLELLTRATEGGATIDGIEAVERHLSGEPAEADGAGDEDDERDGPDPRGNEGSDPRDSCQVDQSAERTTVVQSALR